MTDELRRALVNLANAATPGVGGVVNLEQLRVARLAAERVIDATTPDPVMCPGCACEMAVQFARPDGTRVCECGAYVRDGVLLGHGMTR